MFAKSNAHLFQVFFLIKNSQDDANTKLLTWTYSQVQSYTVKSHQYEF